MNVCPYGIRSCKCFDCRSNADYADCESGYCLTCLECKDKGKAVHDIYLCTGYESRNPQDSTNRIENV